MEFNKTLQDARSPVKFYWIPLIHIVFFSNRPKNTTPSSKFVFLGRFEKKQYGRPCLWLAEIFLTFPLKPLNRIQPNLTRRKISTSFTQFVFFSGWSEKKNKITTLASDWLCHFRPLRNRWIEFKETWQETISQCPLPSLCFRADWKSKMTAMASDLLRHFQLLWNRWTELNETWQEARSQRNKTCKVFVCLKLYLFSFSVRQSCKQGGAFIPCTILKASMAWLLLLFLVPFRSQFLTRSWRYWT